MMMALKLSQPKPLLRSAIGMAAMAALAAVAGHASLVQAQVLRASPSLGSSANSAEPRRELVSGDFIVAIVDADPITNHEVRTRVVRLEQQLLGQGGALPPRSELAKQVLERLINERSQINLGKDTGVKADEPALEFAITQLARQNQLSVADFRKRVESEGVSWTTFREDMRDEIVLGRVREREVDNRVRVTEADVDDYIKTNSDVSGGSPVLINIAQVLVAVPDNPSAAQLDNARRKAQSALERARAGEDFAKLASTMSDGPERQDGGQIGTRETDRYPELFVATVAKLKIGEVADVVRSGAGFHVLKLLERRNAAMPSMLVMQTKARHILLRTSPQLSESQAIAKLNDIRRRVETGRTDFASEARNNSQDGSAAQGGDLGWTNPGTFVPEFEDAMNNLLPGQLAEPVVSRFGVHLIQVTERRQAELSEREQRELIRNAVRSKKTEEQFSNWQQDVRGRAYVEYRDPPLVAAR